MQLSNHALPQHTGSNLVNGVKLPQVKPQDTSDAFMTVWAQLWWQTEDYFTV